MTPGLLIYCRPGFEKEAATEISAACHREGYAKAKPDSGLVLFVPNDPEMAREPPITWGELVFARQMIRDVRLIDDLPTMDRATPVAAAAATLGLRFSDVWLETADTNDAKEMSSFCRKFDRPLRNALSMKNLLTEDARKPRLHATFLSSAAAYVGFTDPRDSAPWPMGIPRLRMPRGAASRSTLKLAEALMVFLSERETADWLHPGLTAVDLGAAPGGWTWQLVRHGLHVSAVDNGEMDPELMSDDRVEHIRADGLTFKPKRPVDWLVCDMVEKPARIATCIARWMVEDRCKRAIFNLKLPMKKRSDELERCRDIIEDAMGHRAHRLVFKQLYHDREEVTGYLMIPKVKTP